MASAELLKAIAVTSELCGRVFSDAAAKVFVDDLSAYPEAQVIGALDRCRKEVRGVLTLADVVSRLDDGRPGAEEAWAMLPMTEADTAVWTVEMSQAFGVVVRMIDAGELIPARMAFKEAYTRLVSQARNQGIPNEWHVTLGHDKNGREAKIAQAVAQGRITESHAQKFIPLPAPVKLIAG